MHSKSKTMWVKRQNSINRAAFVFLLPLAIIMIVFIVYPIMESLHTSLYQWNGISAERKFMGLDNWIKLVRDTNFWYAFRNNLIVMVLSIVIQIPIGLAEATFIEFTKKRGTLFKIVWFVPLLMSSVAVGFLFNYALASNGGIASFFSNLFGGGNIDLLGNPQTALVTVIFVIAWQFVPFYMVYSLAAYTNISEEVYEASIIDGATKPQYFRSIALPLIMPSLKSAAIMSMVGSLKYFDLIYVMTGGGPGTATELMATYMYKQSFSQFNMGYGSAVAGGMFFLITAIALVTMRLINGRKGE